MKQSRPAPRLELIGVDVARQGPRLRPRFALPLFLVALVAALAVAAMRIDLIRMRYALAEAMTTEQHSLDQQRSLTLRLRQLRDPVRLTTRARALGFVTPEKVIDLPAAAALEGQDWLASAPARVRAAGEAQP